jgi:ComF family protein
VPSLRAASFALDVVATILSPSRCSACDAPVARAVAFCLPCASTVERAAAEDPDALAAFTYGGAIARAIARLKYEKRPDLARPLGDLLWRAVAPRAAELRRCAVVPVPLHVNRLAERGYNQAALLASRLVERLDAQWWPLALARGRETDRQAVLRKGARETNVEGAFRARRPERLSGATVLLVDDVRTTGATLAACAQALRDAGVVRVATAVVAKADRAG